MHRALAFAFTFVLAGLMAVPAARAQVSIPSITAEPAFGNVSSAPSGDTVFRAAATDGSVSRMSGTGYRIGSGNTRALVTIACGSSGNCNNSKFDIIVRSIGTPTGRAKALTNFTVSMGTAVLDGGVTGTNPVTFRIAAMGKSTSRTFYIGADLPIYGNESPLAAGQATSQFEVVATMTMGGGPAASRLGTASATVFRALGFQVLSQLAFGTIARPNIGTGSATIDATSGLVSLTGNRILQMPGTTSRARVEVNGEAGQSFSVSIPPTFTLSGPGGPLTVQTSATVTGVQTLDGTPGSSGSKVVGVGGSVQIPYNLASGSYNGSFVVTVVYQ